MSTPYRAEPSWLDEVTARAAIAVEAARLDEACACATCLARAVMNVTIPAVIEGARDGLIEDLS